MVSGQKNMFWLASNTQKGRERKERARTEDCQVSEERNNHQLDFVALLFHSLGHGRLSRREVLMAWWWGSS